MCSMPSPEETRHSFVYVSAFVISLSNFHVHANRIAHTKVRECALRLGLSNCIRHGFFSLDCALFKCSKKERSSSSKPLLSKRSGLLV